MHDVTTSLLPGSTRSQFGVNPRLFTTFWPISWSISLQSQRRGTEALITSVYERRLLLANLSPMLHVRKAPVEVLLSSVSRNINLPPSTFHQLQRSSLCIWCLQPLALIRAVDDLQTRIPQDNQRILRRAHGCVGVSTTAFSGHHRRRPQHSSARHFRPRHCSTDWSAGVVRHDTARVWTYSSARSISQLMSSCYTTWHVLDVIITNGHYVPTHVTV